MDIDEAWEIVRSCVDVAYHPSIFVALKLVEEKFTSTNSAMVPCPGHRKGNVCEIHAHDWLCGNVPCMLSRVEKRMSDGVVLFTEQTKCPSCGNELGNVVLERSASHQHHACGKCFVHYIVESKFLAPFSPEGVFNERK